MFLKDEINAFRAIVLGSRYFHGNKCIITMISKLYIIDREMPFPKRILAKITWFFATVSSVLRNEPLIIANTLSVNSYVCGTIICIFVLTSSRSTVAKVAGKSTSISASNRYEPILIAKSVAVICYIGTTKFLVFVNAVDINIIQHWLFNFSQFFCISKFWIKTVPFSDSSTVAEMKSNHGKTKYRQKVRIHPFT